MIDDISRRTRLRSFFYSRATELLSLTSAIGRRARTLSIRAAAKELHTLAVPMLTSPAINALAKPSSEGVHGASMRPDVAAEALQVLTEDIALKTAPAIAVQLRQTLNIFAEAKQDDSSASPTSPPPTLRPQFTGEHVAKLASLVDVLTNCYIGVCVRALQSIYNSEPQRLFDFEILIEQLFADARSRGWSDSALLEILEGHRSTEDFSSSLEALQHSLETPPREFACFVPVELGPPPNALPFEHGRFKLLSAGDEDFPVSSGLESPLIRVLVHALDRFGAAAEAHSVVSSLLGAASVFASQWLGPKGSRVLVVDGAKSEVIETSVSLSRERYGARPGQIERMVSGVLSVMEAHDSDPVSDAIRHQHRAHIVDDAESRFMLLWTGIERLCGDGVSTALSSIRDHAPRALALAKVRRDLMPLAIALGPALTEGAPPDEETAALLFGGPGSAVKHDVLLKYLLADEAASREFTRRFYDTHVHLVQWYCRLRRRLRGNSGSSVHENVATIIRQSALRTEWHLKRLYRARNWVAHGHRRPPWLTDLTRHTDYYLTNLLAIMVHNREEHPRQSPAETLARRCGQYETYLGLLDVRHPSAITVECILRPTSLVASTNTDAG